MSAEAGHTAQIVITLREGEQEAGMHIESHIANPYLLVGALEAAKAQILRAVFAPGPREDSPIARPGLGVISKLNGR